MKTYFKYEGIIKSKEAAEAIAVSVGLGPFCGFGSATISNNKLIVSPQGVSGNRYANIVKDKILARYLTKSPEDGELPDVNFGCISRDGYVFISDDPTLTIENIQGTQGSTEEVLLFAVHTTISEPVDNPVEFVAYWNESNESFYDLFKKANDVYYPISEANRTPSISNDVYRNTSMTLDNLLRMVETACPYYFNNKGSAILVGIYGRGTDAMTKRNEDFSIVPYQGKFQEIPFTTAVHSVITESIKNLESLVTGFPVSNPENNLNQNIKDYIDFKMAALKKEFEDSLSTSNLPIGSIILWEQDTIPDGWAEYTKASGRIVLGYQAGGIQIGDETVLNNIGDYYTPTTGNYVISIKGDDLPKHRHSVGLGKFMYENSSEATGCTIRNYNLRDTSLNGQVGNYKNNAPGQEAQQGAVETSWNLIGTSSYVNETSNDTLKLEKLPPTITLRYIQKMAY